MLTVKHIDVNGVERIYEARAVQYSPDTAAPDSAPPTVWIEYDNSGLQPMTSWGNVFVMNEKGATIARYHLGGEPEPVKAAA